MTIVGLCFAALVPIFVGAGGPSSVPPIAFRDVTAASGVTFRFEHGSRGRHNLPEIMGGGVALIDADDDGWLDLYFGNGGSIEGGTGPRQVGPTRSPGSTGTTGTGRSSTSPPRPTRPARPTRWGRP
jgi:hypothetical protein